MSFNRTLGNLGKAIDSASAGTFLQRDDATDVDFVSIEYSDLSGTPTTLDSAAAINLIDSAYIQLRQGSLGGGGLDSAAVTTLVDSNYVSARTSDLSSGFFMYDYVATAGQTTFQDSDANGNVLSYGNGGILVFYNGILMRRGSSYDYIEGTNSVTLNTAADSAANITISKWTYAGGEPDVKWYGDRGTVSAGVNSYDIEYFDITTPANATSFGNLSTTTYAAGYASNGSRATVAGGYIGGVSAGTDISYYTISTTGNSSSFGSLTVSQRRGTGTGDGTYGFYIGGNFASFNNIDYVTIATTANAVDFGNLNTASAGAGAWSDGTYVIVGGGSAAASSGLQYFATATTGNASDFGDISESKSETCGAGSRSTFIMAGGHNGSSLTNVLEYVAISTPANSSDFGDLTYATYEAVANSNGNYMVVSGGSGNVTNMDYFATATPGNASDFGDLLNGNRKQAANSGSPA